MFAFKQPWENSSVSRRYHLQDDRHCTSLCSHIHTYEHKKLILKADTIAKIKSIGQEDSDLDRIRIDFQQPEHFLKVVFRDPVDRKVVPPEALYHHHVAYDPCNRIRPMLARFKLGYQIDDGHSEGYYTG